MAKAAHHPTLVPYDGTFRIADHPTSPPSGTPSKGKLEDELEDLGKELGQLQDRLYAADTASVLAVFQAMDAAGKDGTIRAVFKGIDPAGLHVVSFKAPNTEEVEHDFLWRTTRRLPERGQIGIFNRSYYEEVLVVKVNPGFLGPQRLPEADPETRWVQRYASIRDHELHLSRNGVVIVKFFLHVGKDEQRKRLLARIDDPEKHWKFDPADIRARDQWEAYQTAYERALGETSRPWAPWYCIPADDKTAMRVAVAQVMVETLRGLDLKAPKLAPEREVLLAEAKRALGRG